jgi:hypothetical protein
VRAEGENRDYFGVNSACEGVLNKIQTVRVEEDALHYLPHWCRVVKRSDKVG